MKYLIGSLFDEGGFANRRIGRFRGRVLHSGAIVATLRESSGISHFTSHLDPGKPFSKVGSFVQNDGQERSVNLKTAVVLDETEFPEFVHEKIDP
jgi:hypothetical protein